MEAAQRKIAGKYELLDELGVGGMATVHLGRAVGAGGFSRLVAIKRMHRHLAEDPEFRTMFLDEGRLAGRIHHPNVVATLDVLADGPDIFLVMDYVRGQTLARLLRASKAADAAPPLPIVSAVVTGALTGLHAAHEATGDGGRPLMLVHRDVSPDNILVGADGVSRVLDFGVAKAASRLHSTAGGKIRGKIRYMAPEQLRGDGAVDRRADVYAAGIVLWEALAGRRLFDADDTGLLMARVLAGDVAPPSTWNRNVPPELDAVVLQALTGAREDRFATALAMAEALEHAVAPASARALGAWVEELAGEHLHEVAARLAALEAPAVTRVALVTARRAPPEQPTTPAAVIETATAVDDVAPHSAAREAAAPHDEPGKKQRRGLVAAAIGVLAVVVVGGAALALRARTRATTAPASLASTAASASVAAAPALVAAAPPPSAEPGAAALPNDAGTARDVPPASVVSRTGSGRAAPHHRAAPRPAASAAPAQQCSPPYVLDPDGTKRYRPECL